MPDVTCVQEHQLDEQFHKTTIKQFRRAGCELTITPPCTDNGHLAAGTAISVRRATVSINRGPITGSFRRAYERGRACARAVVFDDTLSLMVYLLYGWVGGATDQVAAHQTSALLEATYREHIAQGEGPALIAIDLNADPEHVLFCKTLLEQAKWVDLGAVAGLFGGVDQAPTCLASMAKQASRRDYLIVHPSLMIAAQKVQVHDTAEFSTHSRLSVEFRRYLTPYPCYYAKAIPSLHGAYTQLDITWLAWKQKVRLAIDDYVEMQRSDALALLSQGNLSGVWELFGKTLEQGLLRAAGLLDQGRPPRDQVGRGKQCVSLVRRLPQLPEETRVEVYNNGKPLETYETEQKLRQLSHEALATYRSLQWTLGNLRVSIHAGHTSLLDTPPRTQKAVQLLFHKQPDLLPADLLLHHYQGHKTLSAL